MTPEAWQAVALSLRVSLWAMVFAVPMAIWVAYVLARYEFWGKSILNGLGRMAP